MSKRASLPRADEIFRKTSEDEPISTQEDEAPQPQVPEPISRQVTEAPRPQVVTQTEETVKPKHDEKVTFYCTAEDLTRIERARLELRASHGLASDRGKVVRAALEEILSEFESRGANSSLVRRLQDEE